MAWRASATAIELPNDIANIEVEKDEEDESDHESFVKDVLVELFQDEHLRPGTYNVTIAGHTNKTEDDNADNLSISINRTVA